MASIFPERIETDRLRLKRLSTVSVDPVERDRTCSSDERIEAVTEQVS